MDRIAQWRPIEPAGPEGQAEQSQPRQGTADATGWRLVMIGAVGVAVLTAAGIALWLATPQPELVLEPGLRGEPADVAGLIGDEPAATAQAVAADVVVDVQGAVERPGLHRLAAGSRVGDAIASAGGYSVLVDIDAAAQRLNLAQRLQDGDKIHVPMRGEMVADAQTEHPVPSGEPATGGAGGLINVNTASAEELDTLPGIGPVTAAKIIAAREEMPFGTVDELLGRGVVGPATFEKISELITTGP
jgi:competence protein ComEA